MAIDNISALSPEIRENHEDTNSTGLWLMEKIKRKVLNLIWINSEIQEKEIESSEFKDKISVLEKNDDKMRKENDDKKDLLTWKLPLGENDLFGWVKFVENHNKDLSKIILAINEKIMSDGHWINVKAISNISYSDNWCYWWVVELQFETEKWKVKSYESIFYWDKLINEIGWCYVDEWKDVHIQPNWRIAWAAMVSMQENYDEYSGDFLPFVWNNVIRELTQWNSGANRWFNASKKFKISYCSNIHTRPDWELAWALNWCPFIWCRIYDEYRWEDIFETENAKTLPDWTMIWKVEINWKDWLYDFKIWTDFKMVINRLDEKDGD
jgi:hypothetical protein